MANSGALGIGSLPLGRVAKAITLRLAGVVDELLDLASHRDLINRLVLKNSFGGIGIDEARAQIIVQNGQPSKLVDNDKLTVSQADAAGSIALEFKLTEAFTPTAGYTTVDLSAVVDGPITGPHDVAAAIRTAIEAVATTPQWFVSAESQNDDVHAFTYERSLNGEYRSGAPVWTMATPDGNFSGAIDRVGYSPLIDARGGTQNNITRLGPLDVDAIIKRLALFSGLTGSKGFNISYTDIVAAAVELETPSDVITIRLAPDLPTGAILVGAWLHTALGWGAPTMATITLEIGDDLAGTANVCKPVDGNDASAGQSNGDLFAGRTIQFLTATARITGDVLNNLTSGLSHLEVIYRLP